MLTTYETLASNNGKPLKYCRMAGGSGNAYRFSSVFARHHIFDQM